MTEEYKTTERLLRAYINKFNFYKFIKRIVVNELVKVGIPCREEDDWFKPTQHDNYYLEEKISIDVYPFFGPMAEEKYTFEFTVANLKSNTRKLFKNGTYLFKINDTELIMPIMDFCEYYKEYCKVLLKDIRKDKQKAYIEYSKKKLVDNLGQCLSGTLKGCHIKESVNTLGIYPFKNYDILKNNQIIGRVSIHVVFSENKEDELSVFKLKYTICKHALSTTDRTIEFVANNPTLRELDTIKKQIREILNLLFGSSDA